MPIFLFISLVSHAQWTSLGIENQASFRAIKALHNHIWIGGTKGTVIHSADYGKSWAIQQIPTAEKLDFRDLIIVNEKEVILMSAGLSKEHAAKLFKTTNGGNTWEILYETNEPGYFLMRLHGIRKQKMGSWFQIPKTENFLYSD